MCAARYLPYKFRMHPSHGEGKVVVTYAVHDRMCSSDIAPMASPPDPFCKQNQHQCGHHQ